jgi:large subunit ribosomal protein L17
MRHKKKNKRFGRNSSQRKQLLRSLVRGLFLNYSISTTLAKAKEAGRLADKIITYAKSGALNSIRAIEAILQDRALVSKVVKVLAPLSAERKGGYTRIMKAGFRRGDGAEMAVLELVSMPEKIKKQPKGKAKKAKAEDLSAADKKSQAKQEKAKAKPEVIETEKIEPKAEIKSEAKEKAKPAKPKPESAKAQKAEAKQEEKPKKDKSTQDKKDLLYKFKGLFKKK